MMIDKLLELSDKQTITASAPSTNTVDFGQAHPNTGMDDRSKLVFTVNETVAASGAATVTLAVQDSDDDATFATVASVGPVGKADLPAGAQFVIAMPTRLRRYCRADYTVASGPLSAGKFSAQIVTGIQQNDPYPDSPRIA